MGERPGWVQAEMPANANGPPRGSNQADGDQGSRERVKRHVGDGALPPRAVSKLAFA